MTGERRTAQRVVRQIVLMVRMSAPEGDAIKAQDAEVCQPLKRLIWQGCVAARPLIYVGGAAAPPCHEPQAHAKRWLFNLSSNCASAAGKSKLPSPVLSTQRSAAQPERKRTRLNSSHA